jgi:AcrR family transcriptional regulator
MAHAGGTRTQRPTRAERKAETRERLLRAAETIAAKHGLARVTLDAVAEAAGVTKGAIYSNFESKEELLLEVHARLTPGLDLTMELLEAAESVPDLLASLGPALAEVVHAKAKQAVLAAELDVLLMRDAKLRRTLVDENRRRHDDPDPAYNWFEAHADEFPIPVEQFLHVVNALAIGLLVRRMVFGAEEVPDELMTWAFSRLALRPDD